MEKINDSKREKCYDLIRAAAMLLILVWHFNATCDSYGIPRPIRLLDNPSPEGALYTGAVGVAVFFMLSGALMAKHNLSEFSIGAFYKKRLLRMYVPMIVSWVITFVMCMCMTPDILKGWGTAGMLVNLTGMDYFAALYGINFLWIIGEWFTSIILLIYLIFPVLRYMLMKNWKVSTLLIAVVFLLNLKFQFLQYDSRFSITNGIFCFWMGMLVEKGSRYFKNRYSLCTAAAVCVILMLWNPASLLNSAPLVSVLFGIAFYIALYNIDYSNSFIAYISKYNFEIYLMHHRMFLIFIPLLLVSGVTYLKFIFVYIFLFWIVFIASETVSGITKRLMKLVRQKSI